MDLGRLERREGHIWELPPHGPMRVPGVLFASEALLREMDDQVLVQLANVAALPGIVEAAYAMPDAHWGYGFPIGGVAAFDPDAGGVVSAGGVGFDIACGVRTLLTGLPAEVVAAHGEALARELFKVIPAGVGSTGFLELNATEMTAMLRQGAHWAVGRGFGAPADLERTEEGGCMTHADPDQVSPHARERQRREMGTLGSGNHYLEVQRVAEVLDQGAAEAFGLHHGEVVVSIHCGSRGLGHQVATDFSRRMVVAASRHRIHLPSRELAAAPLDSADGRDYLGAMAAAVNCAMANRQILTHLARQVFAAVLGHRRMPLLYDVSHNTCKVERHPVGKELRRLYVHRKGATRAFGPGHPDLPGVLRPVGQPVLIGGTMGTGSYILAGTASGMERAFGSACHGAGRAMSRTQAAKRWDGKGVIRALAQQGVLLRGHGMRGIAEEAPGAYKDVDAVVAASAAAGLARPVARLTPMICIKG